MKDKTIGTLLTFCLTSTQLLQAEEIVPSEEQTTSKGGTVEVADGIRSVTGKADATDTDPSPTTMFPFRKAPSPFPGRSRKSSVFFSSSMARPMARRPMP